jgi:hypothetical protein
VGSSAATVVAESSAGVSVAEASPPAPGAAPPPAAAVVVVAVVVVVVVVEVVVVSRQADSFEPAPKAVHPSPWRNFMTAFLTKPLPAAAEAFKNPTSNMPSMEDFNRANSGEVGSRRALVPSPRSYLFHRCSASWFFSKSFVQNPFP